MSQGSSVSFPQPEIPVRESFDIIVAGAGTAGMGAAVSAARLGRSVALIEDSGAYGGNVSQGLVSTICGAYYQPQPNKVTPVTGGLIQDIIDRLKKRKGAVGPLPFKGSGLVTFNPWEFKLIADDIISAEENITTFFYTRMIDVIMDGETVTHAILHNKDGLQAIHGQVFIDATGDADLCVKAGADVSRGGPIQFPSLHFFMENVDTSKIYARGLDTLAQVIDEHFDDPEYTLTRRGGNLLTTLRPREVIVAMTHLSKDGEAVDASNASDKTAAEIIGRRAVAESARFLQDHMPGCGKAFISDSAPRIGIRETRRVHGDYSLTADDIRAAQKFDDAITACAWPMETHKPGGVTEWEEVPAGSFYTIPYRCLCVKGTENVLAIGRNLSSTHEALASARVTATCMTTGQAAGTAAAQSCDQEQAIRDVDVKSVQTSLADQGVVMLRT